MNPQITQAPSLAHAAILPRQTTNPLSALISQAITFGNSILSELNSSTAPSSTSSSSFTSSTSSASSASSTTSTTPTAALASSTAIPTSTSSAHKSNLGLILGLAIGLGVLALLLLGLLIFCCMRRRRKSRSANYNKESATGSWVASTEDNRSHLTAPDEGYSYNNNGYPQGMAEIRPHPALMPQNGQGGYDSMSPVSTNSPERGHVNPFVGSQEHVRPAPVFAPGVNGTGISEPSSFNSSDNSARGGGVGGRPNVIQDRPSSPVEMYAALPKSSTTLVNGAHGHQYQPQPQRQSHEIADSNRGGVFAGGHPRNGSESRPRQLQQGSTSIWPSRKAADDFDFGELRREEEMAEPGIPRRSDGGEFSVARRPVSGQATAL